MSFFDSLKSTAKSLGDKASDTAEVAKLKMKISSAESDIKGIYTDMGKKLFEEHPDVLENFFAEEKGKLAELKENIASLQARIEEVKAAAKEKGEEIEEEIEEEASPIVEEIKEEVEEVKEEIEEKVEEIF